MSQSKRKPSDPFVDWFRRSSPYIHAHRGKTFVVQFAGEAVAADSFPNLVHDLALLHALGIRLALVHGARPQISERLERAGLEMRYTDGLRVTDEQAMGCVRDGAAAVRVEIEALLSMGLANSPMHGASIRVVSGNFVTAQPIGVRNGIDYGLTGRVRRIDATAIRNQLESNAVVLVSPLGYSPTGETFNLSSAEVARAVAVAINADKLIYLAEGKGLTDSRGRILTHQVPRELETLVARRKKLSEELRQQLGNAIEACRCGVQRIHLLSRLTDGVLLKELFTHRGAGTLLSAEPYERTRGASIDDIGGILELLTPLEEQGVLVRRSRELLEGEIDRFRVVELDGMIIGCAALYSYPEAQMGELACFVVHPDYRSGGRGDALLEQMCTQARQQGLEKLFVLTTQTAHWFRERGFETGSVDGLPLRKRSLYNYQRNSKVFIRKL